MHTKVYIAAPWVAREQASVFAHALEDRGYTITHPWWDYEGENEATETPEFLCECALKDIMGVYHADVLLVLNTAKSEGKAVEQGLALALGRPLICITPGENPTTNIFHNLPQYTHVKSQEEAIEALERV